MTPHRANARNASGEVQSEIPDEALQHAIQQVLQSVSEDDPRAAITTIEGWTIDDIAQLIVHLPITQARTLVGWMPRKLANEVLLGMHPVNRSTIVSDGGIDNASASDEQYGEGAVAHTMQRDFIALTSDSTAQDVIDAIKQGLDHDQSVGTVFVVDDKRSPVGVFRPGVLLKVRPETTLTEIMQRHFPIVCAADSEEEAAQAAEGIGFIAVPVINEQGQLVGQLTPEMRERILARKRRKNMLQMSSVAADSSSTDGVKKIIRSRLPWLLAGLVGATVAAVVIGSFEEQLAAGAILAAFIPVVMSMAGNSGLQASGVSVQALASGSLWPGDCLAYRIGRECLGALSNGMIAGVILAVLVLLGSTFTDIERPLNLALATSLSLMTVTTIAAIVGSSVPFALHRLGIDPATATGVFITTSNDVIGVFIYFTMADLFYF